MPAGPGLPDSLGVDSVRRFVRDAPDAPVPILAGLDDMDASIDISRRPNQRTRNEMPARTARDVLPRH